MRVRNFRHMYAQRWLTSMSREWSTVRIADVADIYDGPHATPQKTNTGPWFLSISSLVNGRLALSESAHVGEGDFIRWTRRVTPQAGDVLFSYETRLGEAALMPPNIRACLGRRMGLLRPRANINPRFLLYAYLAPQFQREVARQAIHGATVDRIPLNEMGQWLLVIPDRRAQDAIAEVLGALDDKIDANGRVASICEELAKASAETGVRAPVRTFVDMLRGQVKAEEFARDDVAHFSLPAFDTAKLPDRCRGKTIKSGKFLLPEPTVLVSKLNPHIPRVWCAIPPVGVLSLASTEFVVLRPKAEWSAELLWAACAAPSFIAGLTRQVTGTTGSHQRVRPDDVLDTPVADLRRLTDNVRSVVQLLVERAAAAREETRSLARMRDALLPALLTGELRVRDPEAAAEASASPSPPPRALA